MALKVVNLDTPDDDVSDIQREVALLSQLREAATKNVVRYWGCWLKGPELWIVMDFAEGGSVRTLMKAGPIAERYCAVIVRETLVALNYLHKSGIIHRDIKAANILLTSTGKILLCDFGVAASLASSSVHSKRSTFVGTLTGWRLKSSRRQDVRPESRRLESWYHHLRNGHWQSASRRRGTNASHHADPEEQAASIATGRRVHTLHAGLCRCLSQRRAPRASNLEELNKLKWIKTYAKTPVSVLKEVIQSYNAWTKAGGMRMSLIGAETADWGEAGNRDSFAFDGRETGEGWEFNTLRSAREWRRTRWSPMATSPDPGSRPPAVEAVRYRASDGATSSSTGMYGQRSGSSVENASTNTWKPAASTGPTTATLRAQQAPPQLAATLSAAPVAPPTAKPSLPNMQEKASFTGTGNTPFRFGVGGGVGSASQLRR